MAEKPHDHEHDHDRHPAGQEIGEGTRSLLATLGVGFVILRLLLIGMLVAYLFSGFFILEDNEQAYVLRFGKVVGAEGEQVLESGQWHIALPRHLDRIVRVKTKELQTVTINHFWHHEQKQSVMAESNQPPEEAPEGQGLQIRQDGYLLTDNADILHTKWQLFYYITDPLAYTTEYADPQKVIESLLESVILQRMSQVSIIDILYGNTTPLVEALRRDFDERLRDLQPSLGITVQNLVLLDKKPPRQTQQAFNAKVQADQVYQRLVDEANLRRTQLLANGDGEALRIQNEARTYADTMLSKLRADAGYLETIRQEYAKQGKSILVTLYVDTLLEVVERVESKYIVYPGDEVRLNIGPRRQSPNTPQPGQTGPGAHAGNH